MTFAALLNSAAEKHAELIMPTWVFGLIALIVFAILLFVLLSFRDVSNRHRMPAAGADEHVTMPGAEHHGDGHPRHES